MLNSKPRVMSQDEIEDLKAKLGLTVKAAGATVGVAGAFKIVNVLSPIVDQACRNIGRSAINFTESSITKMTKPIVFPYVFSIPSYQIYLGALGLITLLVLFVGVGGAVAHKSPGEIIFECCCILAPVLLWAIMGVF